MRFFKVLEAELNSFVQSVRGKDSSKQKILFEDESEELQGLLNNLKNSDPLTDSTQKQQVSERMKENDVQNAIKHFNKLSSEERESILEEAENALQKKLMDFMEVNAKFTDNIDGTNFLIRHVSKISNSIAEKKTYTDKEIAVLVKDFQRLYANSTIEADRVMNAFIEYRGNSSLGSGKICEGNKDEFAISLCSQFKQAMKSYNQVFISNIQELRKASESSKQDFMNNITRTVEKIESEVERFQNSARELMNAFIPDVIVEENRFSKNTSKYLENGVPSDLCLNNKVIENILIDSLLDASHKSQISDAA